MAENATFDSAQRAALRAEIKERGFHLDEFLSAAPARSVMGLNLACAYPFPAQLRSVYSQLEERISGLDPAVYVYPLWETHVTVMTFVNFTLFPDPTNTTVNAIKQIAQEVTALLEPIFSRNQIGIFDLTFEKPVLTRKAAILPLANPSGEIAKLRGHVIESLAKETGLRDKLVPVGFNIPKIIHSTFARFQAEPKNPVMFAEKFDALTDINLGSMTIDHFVLTSETRPYMRRGDILRRFPLQRAGKNFA